jgi:hypothetical protein
MLSLPPIYAFGVFSPISAAGTHESEKYHVAFLMSAALAVFLSAAIPW